MERMTVNAKNHESTRKKRVGKLKVSNIGELASSHFAVCLLVSIASKQPIRAIERTLRPAFRGGVLG